MEPCCRFASVLFLECDEALRRAVRANRRALMDSVMRLRGKFEMHLKLVVRDESLRGIVTDSALPNVVGSEYLLRLRAKAARQRERQSKARAISDTGSQAAESIRGRSKLQN